MSVESSDGPRLVPTWNANADSWTQAIRNHEIPSRALTDAVIVEVVLDGLPPAGRVLDMGCGEGWLARALHALGAEVHGIDASSALVARAREFDGAAFETLTFSALEEDSKRLRGPYDAVVFNFSLLSDSIHGVLRAASRRLDTGGRIIIQTAHPIAASAGDYTDGWRLETFESTSNPFAPMPWYFRTFGAWFESIFNARLHITSMLEPRASADSDPESLLIVAEVP